VTCRRAVAAAPPDSRERAALRREQLAGDQVKARQKRLFIPTGPSGDDSGSRRQADAVPGGYSGRATLRREQCHMLEVESP
jgi:hypothetical protein